MQIFLVGIRLAREPLEEGTKRERRAHCLETVGLVPDLSPPLSALASHANVDLSRVDSLEHPRELRLVVRENGAPERAAEGLRRRRERGTEMAAPHTTTA